jgi:hypothetical protein
VESVHLGVVVLLVVSMCSIGALRREKKSTRSTWVFVANMASYAIMFEFDFGDS